MQFSRSSRQAGLRIEALLAFGFLGSVPCAMGGCGSGASATDTQSGTNTPKGHSSSSSSSGSGFAASSSSSSSGSGAGLPSSSSGGGDDASLAAGDDASGSASDDAASADSPAPAADAPVAATCVKGQVPPTKVVMIGDSYLDAPAWSNVAPDLFMDARNAGSLGANATYRQYQLGGAAMNYESFNLNIPYQYENTAKSDLAVTNPTDIDTVIMDGGGNDVIIFNKECLTASGPPSGSDMCSMSIAGTLAKAKSVLEEMAADHVKHIVYFFYPHLDPAGGVLLPTPSPGINATLDYAYPLAEQICCGSSFTATPTSYTCSGNTSGTQCIFVDTRPAFEGHIADYIKPDHVHPTPAGSQVIADLLWKAMVDNCIAQ